VLEDVDLTQYPKVEYFANAGDDLRDSDENDSEVDVEKNHAKCKVCEKLIGFVERNIAHLSKVSVSCNTALYTILLFILK
jgi:hypothetical protein